ncbi:DUF7662 domain-containing protein [Actinomadura sp. ATCC 39365]
MTRAYRRLRAYFQDSGLVRIDLSFGNIEEILQDHLPDRAFEDETWWTRRRRPWAKAGFRATQIYLPEQAVRFRKSGERDSRRRSVPEVTPMSWP